MLKDTIKELFTTHPKVDEVFKTSDDQFFFLKENADYHAQKLKDRGVATISKTQVNIEVEAVAGDPSLHHSEAQMPTVEEAKAKAAADAKAQETVNALFGSAAVTTIKVPGSATEITNVEVAAETPATEGAVTAKTDGQAAVVGEAITDAANTAATLEGVQAPKKNEEAPDSEVN